MARDVTSGVIERCISCVCLCPWWFICTLLNIRPCFPLLYCCSHSQVFRKARAVAPSIVFFDEIDALAGERGRYSMLPHASLELEERWDINDKNRLPAQLMNFHFLSIFWPPLLSNIFSTVVSHCLAMTSAQSLLWFALIRTTIRLWMDGANIPKTLHDCTLRALSAPMTSLLRRSRTIREHRTQSCLEAF